MRFPEWVELAAAFVRLEAAACGFVVWRHRPARSTRSVYVDLRGPAGVLAVVRLSDHAPRKGTGRRQALFSVHQARTARLGELRAFLAGRIGRVLGVEASAAADRSPG